MDRYRIYEPRLDLGTNRQLDPDWSGEQAYRELAIHHPNANRAAVSQGRPELADRTAAIIDGEMEAVRTRNDLNGIPLVQKDLIFTNDRDNRNVMIPAPVQGYAHITNDRTNSIGIYSRPFGTPGAELVGQVLHGERGSITVGQDQYVQYGQPLVRQSDVGSPGAVHAHVEAEPEQFRKYLGDVLSGRITQEVYPQSQDRPQQQTTPAQAATPPAPAISGQPGSMADGVLKQGEHGKPVESAQHALGKLGYLGQDGKPLKPDGDFGPNTRHAVESFQKAHGLEVDGKIGTNTFNALRGAAEYPLVSEATHPNHGLHGAIGKQLPAGTRPEVIANVTLQAMENGITGPDKLKGVMVRDGDAFVVGTNPGDRVKVDLSAPTPDLQQMSRHMQAESVQSQLQRVQPEQQVAQAR